KWCREGQQKLGMNHLKFPVLFVPPEAPGCCGNPEYWATWAIGLTQYGCSYISHHLKPHREALPARSMPNSLLLFSGQWGGSLVCHHEDIGQGQCSQ
uniref:Uncharacterized protein n=1 Tax=Terrapene triunguis TaxID=2587831 RepID=A0A674KH61_9SAUR